MGFPVGTVPYHLIHELRECTPSLPFVALRRDRFSDGFQGCGQRRSTLPLELVADRRHFSPVWELDLDIALRPFQGPYGRSLIHTRETLNQCLFYPDSGLRRPDTGHPHPATDKSVQITGKRG